MSVFDGDIEFRSVYMVDYVKKDIPKISRINPGSDDNCMIVGVERDSLKTRDEPKKTPDTLCTIDLEYYKKALSRLKNNHPKLVKKYDLENIDITPVENEYKDMKRTEYLYSYCSRDLPFMSVNLARRARALQTLRLPDDIVIPDTTYLGSYRHPSPDKYLEHPSLMSSKSKPDLEFRNKLRHILGIRTGETTYEIGHALLGDVILEHNPYGPAREEPKYGRWKNPYTYTYRIN